MSNKERKYTLTREGCPEEEVVDEGCTEFKIESDDLDVVLDGCTYTLTLKDDLRCPPEDCDECCDETVSEECDGFSGTTLDGAVWSCGKLVSPPTSSGPLPDGEYCPVGVTVVDGEIVDLEECDLGLDAITSDCLDIDTSTPGTIRINPPTDTIADGTYNGFEIECGFVKAYLGSQDAPTYVEGDGIGFFTNTSTNETTISIDCNYIRETCLDVFSGTWAGNADYQTLTEAFITATDVAGLCVDYTFPADIGNTFYQIAITDANGASVPGATITRRTDGFEVCYPDNSTYYLSVTGAA